MLGTIPFDCKSLFSALRVFDQRAVCKTKSGDRAVFFDDVDNASSVQRTESEVMYQHCDVSSHLDWGIRPAEPYPRHVEHLPSSNSGYRSMPNNLTAAKQNAIAIYVVVIK